MRNAEKSKFIVSGGNRANRRVSMTYSTLSIISKLDEKGARKLSECRLRNGRNLGKRPTMES